MAYATQQDLIDRFGEAELIQRTDTTNKPATTIDADVVAAAIGDAEALADSYLAKKYALPLSTVPDVLIRMVADIARYYLHGRVADKNSAVKTNHDDAIAWLRDVAKGVVQLEAAGVAADQTGSGEIRTSGPERTFTRDTMGGY